MRMGRRKATGLYVVRELSGRLSRGMEEELAAASPAAIKRLANAALRGMADAEWGTELGLLYLGNHITSRQFESGKRWNKLVVAYHRAIGSPAPVPRAVAFMDVATKSAAPDPDSELGRIQAKRDRAAVEAMKEAHAVLIASGMLSEATVRTLCEENERPVGAEGMIALRRGLDWLAEHWAIPS